MRIRNRNRVSVRVRVMVRVMVRVRVTLVSMKPANSTPTYLRSSEARAWVAGGVILR